MKPVGVLPSQPFQNVFRVRQICHPLLIPGYDLGPQNMCRLLLIAALVQLSVFHFFTVAEIEHPVGSLKEVHIHHQIAARNGQAARNVLRHHLLRDIRHIEDNGDVLIPGNLQPIYRKLYIPPRLLPGQVYEAPNGTLGIPSRDVCGNGHVQTQAQQRPALGSVHDKSG